MKQKLPEHVAIVMDGNGRWATERKMPRFEGHRAGVEAVKTIIRCCLEKKIKYLSLFAFSSENWLRPAEEVAFLMDIFLESLQKRKRAFARAWHPLVFHRRHGSIAAAFTRRDTD